MFEELKKDPAFLKQRNLLLGVTVIGGALMLAVAGLMFFKVLDLLDLISAIVVYVSACVFTSRPLGKMKEAATEKLRKEDEERARQAAWLAAQTPPADE